MNEETPMPGSSRIQILDQRSADEMERPFLPAAGRSWLLPFYDVFTRVAGVHALHERVIELAGVAPGAAVVDVGCGTGNLSFALLAAVPDAKVTGLDPDAAALLRAAPKALARGVSITLVQGYANRIPAADGSLDHIVSSLALHHVDEAGRGAFAHDALRALRPGGKVTIVDLGGQGQGESAAHAAHGGGLAHLRRHLSGSLRSRVARGSTLEHNHDGGIVTLLADAGFTDAREVDRADHRFGPVTFVQASRP